jgi:hypothetical protein
VIGIPWGLSIRYQVRVIDESAIRLRYETLAPVLDERDRRRFGAAEAGNPCRWAASNSCVTAMTMSHVDSVGRTLTDNQYRLWHRRLQSRLPTTSTGRQGVREEYQRLLAAKAWNARAALGTAGVCRGAANRCSALVRTLHPRPVHPLLIQNRHGVWVVRRKIPSRSGSGGSYPRQGQGRADVLAEITGHEGPEGSQPHSPLCRANRPLNTCRMARSSAGGRTGASSHDFPQQF